MLFINKKLTINKQTYVFDASVRCIEYESRHNIVKVAVDNNDMIFGFCLLSVSRVLHVTLFSKNKVLLRAADELALRTTRDIIKILERDFSQMKLKRYSRLYGKSSYIHHIQAR